MASGPITSWQIDGETMERVTDVISWGSKITADGDCSYEIKRHLLLGRKAMTKLDSIWKSRDIAFPTNVFLFKTMVFPVVTYECESWNLKKAECRKIGALSCGIGEDSWESLGLKKVKPVNPKGNQSWVFIGRIDTETKSLILWPPDTKNCLTREDPDAGEDWRQEEKGTTQDDMVGCNHLLNEHEWANSGKCWRTGKTRVQQSTGSQRVRHNWAIEQQRSSGL